MNLRTLFCAAALCGSTCFAATEQWTFGVNADSGWYDSNKVGDDTDLYLCWAATTSNMLAWWQHQVSNIPSGTPDGYAIWDTMKQSVTNLGGEAVNGLSLWMTGTLYPGAASVPSNWSTLKTATAGGYYKTALSANQTSVTTTFNSATTSKSWNDSTTVAVDPQSVIYNVDWTADSSISQVLPILQAGLAAKKIFGLGIANSADNGHAITLWGITYEGDTLTKITVSDSDDTMDAAEPDKSLKRTYDFNVTTVDGKLKLSSDDKYGKAYGTNDYFLSKLTSLSANVTIPEPGSTSLCLLGLAALMLRRRDRR